MGTAISYTGRLAMPASLWAATATAAPPTQELKGEVRARVAIVGGGYTGLSTALYLAERGVDAVLLEAAEPGFGASGRNGGQVIPGLKHDPDTLLETFGENGGHALIAFGGQTADRTFDLIRRHGIECDADQNGWLQPAVNVRKVGLLQSRAEQWRRHAGLQPQILDRDETRRLTGTDAYVGACIDPRGGRVQPLSYARGLAAAAVQAGARVFSHALVTAIGNQNGGWTISTDSGEVQTDKLVIATNGYTGNLWPGLRETVLPATSVQVATEPLPEELRREVLPGGLPVSDTRRLLHYMRYDADGRFIIGGRGSFGQREPERHFRRLRRTAVRMFPVLAETKWSFAWGGTVALTLDGMPHLHELAPGAFAALGYNGRGVAMATEMGRLLAEAATGAPMDDLPIPAGPPRPLPYHRFRRPGMEAAAAWYRALDRLGW